MSYSSRSPGKEDSSRPWLQEKVYAPKLERTIRLVRLSITALQQARQKISLSSLSAKSKEVDPDKKGVSESAILNNEEARGLYLKCRSWNKSKVNLARSTGSARRSPFRRIKIDRDIHRAKERYSRLTKGELIDRLIESEQAYAELDARYIRTNESMLSWQLRAQEAEARRQLNPAGVSLEDGAISQPKAKRSIGATLIDQRPGSKPPQPSGTLNNYDYFSDIENAFVKRRGKHLLLSPLDWSLIETWKDKGIPLHIVLSGIDKVFDSRRTAQRLLNINSLMYCRDEVESQFAEWLRGQAGSNASPSTTVIGHEGGTEEPWLPFDRQTIVSHLSQCRARLSRACTGQNTPQALELLGCLNGAAVRLQELEDAFVREAHPDASELEVSLADLDILIAQAIRANIPTHMLPELREEAAQRIPTHRNGIDRSAYEQMLDNIILKRMRDEWGIPRLSLFYL